MNRLQIVERHEAAVGSGQSLAVGRWALALGVVALGIMPEAVLAKPNRRPSACIPMNDRARCERDADCCDGAICAGRCRRGCKFRFITDDSNLDRDGDGFEDVPRFIEPGDLNPDNDCQWCVPAVDRFGWTNIDAGFACGDQTYDECTNPDTCDGSGTCLDNHEPTTAPCGDEGTECTNQDYCDGVGGCTDNGFMPATTACGDPTDNECDNPDHCSGIDDTCEPNYETAGAACGDDERACTYADACDGFGGCIDNGFKPATTACGDPTDSECDNPDHCSGFDGVCEPNYETAGKACGDDEGACTYADACDETGGCTDNGFKPATTACGDPTDNACDKSDHCSGTDGTCVPAYEPIGTACGDTAGACTNADACDGIGNCTDAGFVTAGTACGDSTDDDCTDPDTCDGSGMCQANDEDYGTVCTGGVCGGDGACCLLVCNDPDTGVRLCGQIDNGCGETLDCGACAGTAEGQGCAFGLVADNDGTCRQRLRTSCDNDSDCASGLCECTGSKSGAQCDTGGGVCLLGRDAVCVQDSDCNSADRCDPSTDGTMRCLPKPLPLGAECVPLCSNNTNILYESYFCVGGTSQICLGGPNAGIPCRDPDGDGWDIETCQVPPDHPLGLPKGGRCGGDACWFRGTICKGGGSDDGERCTDASECDGGICEEECPGGGECMVNPQGGRAHGTPTFTVPGSEVLDGPCPESKWMDLRCIDPREPESIRGCYKSAVDPSGPLAYGGPVCCLALGEVCQDDTDCCKGGFGEPDDSADPYAARACLAATSEGPKTCRHVARAGDACATDDDCVGRSPLACSDGICVGAPPDALEQGALCKREDGGIIESLGECGPGLVCSDCNTAGNGWRCTPPLDHGGCCGMGNDLLDECPGVNGFFCNDASGCRAGEPCSSDDDCGCFGSGDFGQCEFKVTDPGTCCNFECTQTSIDNRNCGGCGNDCSALPDGFSGCFTASEATTCSHYSCDFEYQCTDDQTCGPDGTCYSPIILGDVEDPACCEVDPGSECCAAPDSPTCACTLFEWAARSPSLAELGAVGNTRACVKDDDCWDSTYICVPSCDDVGVSNGIQGCSGSGEGVCRQVE